jgi:alpha-ketoglutarate-dependent taurine dioxygenase
MLDPADRLGVLGPHADRIRARVQAVFEVVVRGASNEPANAGTVPLNTPELHVDGLAAAVPDFFDDLLRRLYDPANVYAQAWQAEDFVITDNHVLLHGRTPYRSKAPRRLWRVHVL